MTPSPLPLLEIANRSLRFLLLLAAIPIAWLASGLGLLHSVLFLFLLLMVPRTLLTRGILLWRKKLVLDWWRDPFKKEKRLYAIQFALRAGFWILSAVALTSAIIPIQFDGSDYTILMGLIWGAAILLVLIDVLPSVTVRVSTFAAFGLAVLGLLFQLVPFALNPGDAVLLDPPVRGEWYVIHGGRGSLFNHHASHREQCHAIDMLRAREGRTYSGDPALLESYFAWDQDVVAPADGVVVRAENSVPDERIGATNTSVPEGNAIVLRIGDRFVLLAHLKRGSVRVNAGDSVKSGQILARCGNSGNTSEPHLHIQVQSHASLWDSESRTFPIHFKGVGYLRRNDRPRFPD